MTSTTQSGVPQTQLGLRDVILYVVTVLSWSMSWYALSLQVGTVAVPTSLFWRFLIATLIMMVWVRWARLQMSFSIGQHVKFAALGLFLFCLNFTLFYLGSAYLISGLLSVVFSLASIFNLAIAYLLYQARPDRRVLMGAVLGLAGITLMFLPEVRGQSWNTEALIGLAFCVAGTLSFCLGNQVSAGLQTSRVPVLSSNAWGMMYGTLLSGIFSLMLGYSLAVEFSPTYLISLFFLAIVSSVIAFWAYLSLVGSIGAGRASYATVVFPVFALIISAFFEGYSLAPIAFVGLALVLIGNVLVLGGGKPTVSDANAS